jgi:mRNA interferase RelE/StbE
MPEAAPYTVKLSDQAEADFKRLDPAVAKRIRAKLRWLAQNAAIAQHLALTGLWSGFYKLRVGRYRIVYRLRHDLRLIRVELIDHRKQVYRR